MRTSDPPDHQLGARIDAVDAVLSVLYPDLAIVPVDQPPQSVEEQASLRSGCSVHYILVRFDDVPSETVRVTVQRGANYLHFQKPDGSYNNGVLDGILDSDEMIFRLDQYGEGQ